MVIVEATGIEPVPSAFQTDAHTSYATLPYSVFEWVM